jgi:hypothetical protein
MIFRSKADNFFVAIISITILIISAVTLLPVFIDKNASAAVITIMFAIFIVSAGIIVWTAFFIKYFFYEDFLLVKGGPFRSKIPYQTITKVSSTGDIFTGYRILSSKQGLEIFYKSATLGSVKISPENKTGFITELKKRCPDIQIQE